MSCWQELYDFHKFYVRVEEAHAELGSETKKKEKIVNIGIENEDFKPSIEKITFEETPFEPHISIKGSLQGEDFLEADVAVKEEENEEPIIEDSSSTSRNKKSRKLKSTDNDETVIEDPLSKKRQSRKISTRKTRNCKVNEIETLAEKSELDLSRKSAGEETDMKEVSSSLEMQEDGQNNGESDSDSNYEPIKDVSEKSEKKLKSANHMNDKFLKENFKINCSVCLTPAETFHALCKHFKSEHKQIGFVICCKKKFYRRSLLVDHVHQHVDPNYFKCTICDKVMADRKCLNMHNKTHNDKKEKVHPCDICNKKFSMNMSLKLHKMSHLSEDEKHVPCLDCGKK